MRRITFAVAATIILGALIIALPKLKSEVRANPVASPATAQIGSNACKDVKFKPASPKCVDDKIYGSGQGWKIQ